MKSIDVEKWLGSVANCSVLVKSKRRAVEVRIAQKRQRKRKSLFLNKNGNWQVIKTWMSETSGIKWENLLNEQKTYCYLKTIWMKSISI